MIRALQPGDSAAVLRINAAAAPAVVRLDPHELSRLIELSGLHLAATGDDGAVAGYLLAFSSGDAYDGEGF